MKIDSLEHVPGVAGRILELPRVGSRLTDSLIEQLRQSGTCVLPLTAYPRRPLPEPVIEAAILAIRQMRHAPAQGLPELRSAVASNLSDELRCHIAPDTVLITNGGMDALNLAMAALLDPGDEVLIFSPCYFFEGIVQLAGGVCRYVPLKERYEYAYDLDRLEASITPRTKIILLTTPNNPTGHVASETELIGVAEIANRRGLFVIADESYDKLVYDGGKHLSARALPGMEDRILLVRSFTKSYSLSEWRVGFIVCPRQMVSQLVKLLEWRTLFNNYLSQKVAEAALTCAPDWLAGLADEFQRNRDLLLEDISETAGLTAVKPEGSPFLFVNIDPLCVPCERFSELLLTEYGVPTTPGCWHQERGHIRIAFGGAEETIREAVNRIGQAVRKIEAGGSRLAEGTE